MKIISFFNRTIAACFYLLFFLVPLIFSGDTSELFEFNKMWITFTLTILIMLTWFSKMIVQKRFFFQRTPFDIPILLFFLSQCIATIFSLDSYVSFWGYYSRFNGGFLSTLSYLLLYYAFVSNLGRKQVLRIVYVSLFSGLIVALWGLPSHFGYDPTCFVFRGNFDVSCWTDAFQPKVRIFSTLGQPDWMAAYMALLIPIAIALGISNLKCQMSNFQKKEKRNSLDYWELVIKNWKFIFYLLLTALFYIDLIFTRSRSGLIASWASLIFFFAFYFWLQKKQLKHSLILNSCFLLLFLGITFFVGTPIDQVNRFTFPALQSMLVKPQASPQVKKAPPAAVAPLPIVGELGGTDSGKIRLFVWKGALEAWKHFPIFGTGVETFAFAYYKFRPAGHNLTSEWDYLYNKAHNEYLNYLATTGAFGLLTYLAFICLFLYIAWKRFPSFSPDNYKQQQQMLVTKELIKWDQLLIIALVAGFISILISNFFGFSVVIMNIYLFLIPAFVISRENLLKVDRIFRFPKVQSLQQKTNTSPWQLLTISVLIIIAGFFLFTLLRYWVADKSYAYGSNLDHAGYYQQANPYLRTAVEAKPQEPVFVDELSSNDAILATAYEQKDATTAGQLAQEALQLSNQTVTSHPNNVVYWKTRVRVFYSLAQLNQQYISGALDAIQKAHQLAPSDAKISYNLGLLYAQTGNIQQGIATMQQTIALKVDYQDAYYALGLFYRQQAIDKNGTIINKEAEHNAVNEMHFILDHFNKSDKGALDSLKNWGEQ